MKKSNPHYRLVQVMKKSNPHYRLVQVMKKSSTHYRLVQVIKKSSTHYRLVHVMKKLSPYCIQNERLTCKKYKQVRRSLNSMLICNPLKNGKT